MEEAGGSLESIHSGANMSKPNETAFSSEDIDRIVEAEADDDTAWGEPIHVRPPQSASVTLSGDLAARAAFLARVHREKSLGSWLLQIIQDRIELEEGAFAAAKRELGIKAPA